ncbi:type II secretion system F family protein [Stutzerimonas kirkiae]|uniref:type II secretion system F family protein n=1 Tax=Stutzerimonas kirkiae TaxID=2211392 RepID=UPI0023EA6B85|nr:type II secretion system F family protein [Stutzerimonas kirkiae]
MRNHLFSWEGTDSQGRRLGGELSAASPLLARARLRSQGVRAPRVRRKVAPLFAASGRRVVSLDIALFTRQMATMLKAGVPLLQALEIIREGIDKQAMRTLIGDIRQEIASGNSFSGALRKWPGYFDELYCNLIVAGEQSGALDVLLDRVATYQERGALLKGRVRRAMAYPLAVIMMGFIVSAILLVKVVPEFEAVFADFGAELPLFTRSVVGLSDAVRQVWYLLLPGVIMGTLGYGYLYRCSRRVRDAQERISLRLPVVGGILRKAAIARYARTLATTFAAGVPLVDALVSVAGATGNVVFRNAVAEVRTDVSSGHQLHAAMRRCGVFPSMVVQMVAIGEEAGALDDMLGKSAGFYEAEVDNAVDNLTTLMEPAIMAVLGVLVGGLIIAMYLPIFQLGNVVG